MASDEEPVLDNWRHDRDTSYSQESSSLSGERSAPDPARVPSNSTSASLPEEQASEAWPAGQDPSTTNSIEASSGPQKPLPVRGLLCGGAGAADSDDSTDDETRCSVCFLRMVHPVRLPCGHVFCFLCVKGVVMTSSPRCALCRHPISQDFLLRPTLVMVPALHRKPHGSSSTVPCPAYASEPRLCRPLTAAAAAATKEDSVLTGGVSELMLESHPQSESPCGSGDGLPTSDGKLPDSGSGLPSSGGGLLAPAGGIPAPDGGLPAMGGSFPVPDGGLPAPDGGVPAPGGESANSAVATVGPAACPSPSKSQAFRAAEEALEGSKDCPPNVGVTYQWFYEGRNGWWKYDERTNKEIEAAYLAEESTCQVMVVGLLFVVDFGRMLQYRVKDPTKRRKIKRDISSAPVKGIAGISLKRLDGVDDDGPNAGSDYNDQNQVGLGYGSHNRVGLEFSGQNQVGAEFGSQNRVGAEYAVQNQGGAEFGSHNLMADQHHLSLQEGVASFHSNSTSLRHRLVSDEQSTDASVRSRLTTLMDVPNYDAGLIPGNALLQHSDTQTAALPGWRHDVPEEFHLPEDLDEDPTLDTVQLTLERFQLMRHPACHRGNDELQRRQCCHSMCHRSLRMPRSCCCKQLAGSSLGPHSEATDTALPSCGCSSRSCECLQACDCAHAFSSSMRTSPHCSCCQRPHGCSACCQHGVHCRLSGNLASSASGSRNADGSVRVGRDWHVHSAQPHLATQAQRVQPHVLGQSQAVSLRPDSQWHPSSYPNTQSHIDNQLYGASAFSDSQLHGVPSYLGSPLHEVSPQLDVLSHPETQPLVPSQQDGESHGASSQPGSYTSPQHSDDQ